MLQSTFIAALLLGVSSVLAQDSSTTDSLFTIQTSPPTPSDTASSAISTSTSLLSGSSVSGFGSATSSGSAVGATATSPSQFPEVCAGNCSAISNALATCGTGTLNTTCLCTAEIEQSYLTCVECALDLNPDPNSLPSYQALIDSYINQCATAEENPVTLSNVTVTLPSTSAASGSASSTGSASVTSSASRSGTSVLLPSSMVSHAPLSSSAVPSAAASASSSGAATSMKGEIGMRWGVTLVSLGALLGGGALIL